MKHNDEGEFGFITGETDFISDIIGGSGLGIGGDGDAIGITSTDNGGI